jgi:hypothetical protein
VVHVNRVAPDDVRGCVQWRVLRPAEVLEQRVANVGICNVDRDGVTARPGRTFGSNDDVSREVSNVRQEVERAVEVASCSGLRSDCREKSIGSSVLPTDFAGWSTIQTASRSI